MADLHLDAFDYKKFFKNKEKRLKLVSLFSFLPTKLYLRVLYRIKIGRKLDLKNPKLYSEKLNWLKINDIHPEYTNFVDKIWMKKYISEKFGKEHIISMLGQWDSYDDIDFDLLPDKFVLKCNHDSGSIKIIEDKSKINHNELRKFYKNRLSINPYNFSREYPYKNVKPKIFAEELYKTDNGNIINDYRFFCFNGKMELFYIFTGRYQDERQTWFDKNLNKLDIIDPTNPVTHDHIEFPSCLDKMIEMAEEIAKGKRECRVDLYEDSGNYYFGELTFFPYGGFISLKPEKWEKIMGDYIDIDT